VDRGSYSASMSRRRFLKLTGAAGATVGLSMGLGGLVAACSDESESTTTAGVTTSASDEATTTTAPAATTTSVSTGAETGREIKIGVVSPQTGPLAMFGIADQWSADLTTKTIGDGRVLGDGKKHSIKIVFQDTQSDSNRASQVAGDLISNQKVDIITVSGSPDTVLPAANQCEALETPMLSVFCPWAAFVFSRGGDFEKPFKWTYGHLLGMEQGVTTLIDMFNMTQTNKKVGFAVPNTADGLAWINDQTGALPFFQAAGYTVINPGEFQSGNEDFTAQITHFKKEGCEVLAGAMTTLDFINFWKQCLQQGFNPKTASMDLALSFPQAAEAIGPSVYGLLMEGLWHRTFPYTDTLTGLTCKQLADDYEQATGSQYTSAIGSHAKISWAIDVLERATDLDDKETIIAAIQRSKLETILGPVDMTSPLDQNPLDPMGIHPHPNCTKTVMTGQQWVKGPKWPYDVAVVSSSIAPDIPKVSIQAIKYS
jgi:branched-chain amino acid transport system substrate-binding protein